MTDLEALKLDIALLKAWQEQESVTGSGDYAKGLLCGVEDRDLQQNGYDAMRYGYDRALERVAEHIDPLIADIEKRIASNPLDCPLCSSPVQGTEGVWVHKFCAERVGK